MLTKGFLTQILSRLCVPGGEWWSEHRELSLLPASVHGAVAKRSHVRCHHRGYEEVRAPLSLSSASAFCFALQQNAWRRKGTEGIQLPYKSTETFVAILSHILLFFPPHSPPFNPYLLPPSSSCCLTMYVICFSMFMSYFVYFLPPVGSQISWKTWLPVPSLPSCCTAVRWKQTPTRSRSSWRKICAHPSNYFLRLSYSSAAFCVFFYFYYNTFSRGAARWCSG